MATISANSAEGRGELAAVLAGARIGRVALAEDADDGAAKEVAKVLGRESAGAPPLAVRRAQLLDQRVERRLAVAAVECSETVRPDAELREPHASGDPSGGEVRLVALHGRQ